MTCLANISLKGTWRILSLFLLTSLITLATASAARPPVQPETGPGGTEYTHNDVVRNTFGWGGTKYYLFEPSDPKPETAPLIAFMHGFTAVMPSPYIGWIDHLVKKGNIVVYPVYQSMASIPFTFTPNAIKSIKDAIEVLQGEDHVTPDLNRFAVVGHSCGGNLAPNIAALAAENGLPMVKAVMSVQPGIDPMFRLTDLSKIPSDTLLLTIAGDRDMIVGIKDARKIYRETTQIPPENKNYILMQSDGSISATHFAPCSSSSANALDYYCFWKLFDALTDAAFYGLNREYALGNTPEQRFMGLWSDGTPFEELEVVE